MLADLEEFNRKIELGESLKLVLDKHGVNENSQYINNKEAL